MSAGNGPAYETGSPMLLPRTSVFADTSIHPTAWNKNSRKFTCSARGSATFVTSRSYTSCLFCGNTRRILGLAYLLNYSGVTYTLGLAFAATGALFPFFASFIGWLGVALTGSDTSSNALFANLQKVTAQQIGVNPILTVGANSSGGVLGKMISPQNLTVGTSATGLQGKEGDLLRLVLKWSLGLTLVMAVWVTLQAYVLKFLIP